MGVIKRADAATLARDAVVLDLADISQQAEAILSQAKREAARVRAEAEAERERLISDARTVGHAEGVRQGLAEGRSKGEAAGRDEALAAHNESLERVQKVWADALAEFTAQRDHLIIACKQDVLRLVLSIAERVVRRVVEHDETVVMDQIEAALRLVSRPTRLVIGVHPEDLRVAESALPSIVAGLGVIEHAELREEPSLDRGSCVVRTDAGGVVDASLRTLLDHIAGLLVSGPATLTEDADSDSHSDEAGLVVKDETTRGDLAA